MMNHYPRLRLIVFTIVFGVFGLPGMANAIDAPHEIYNCTDCHGLHPQGEKWPALLANLCTSCHFQGGPATAVETHSSLTTDNGYGNWDLDCWACHDPHTQEQNKYWGSTYGKFVRRFLGPYHPKDTDYDVKVIDPGAPGPYYPRISVYRDLSNTNVEFRGNTEFIDSSVRAASCTTACADDTATSSGTYTGTEDETYTLEVTTPGGEGTAVLTCTTVITGDACNPSTTYIWNDVPISIGSFGVTISIEDTGADGLATGEQWQIRVTPGDVATCTDVTNTPSCLDDTAYTGITYTGPADGTYTLEVTTAGTSGNAELTCTTSIAGDACNPSATYTWTDDTPISIGSNGVNIIIKDGGDGQLALGEKWTMPSVDDDICQVCHEQTGNYNRLTAINTHNDYGADTQPGGNCLSCHTHADGFMPAGGGCLGCHDKTQPNADGIPTPGVDDYRRQVVESGGTGGDFNRTSHHVTDLTTTEIVTQDDCLVCHDHADHMQQQGAPAEITVLLNDPDSTANFTYDGTGSSIEGLCTGCHDDDGATASVPSTPLQPFTDGRTPPDIEGTWTTSSHGTSSVTLLATEKCLACHGGDDATRTETVSENNVHGAASAKLLSGLIAGEVPANDEEGICYSCHDGDPAPQNIEFFYNGVTNYQSVGDDGALINQRHDVSDADQAYSGGRVECNYCHNPHIVTSTYKNILPNPTDYTGPTGLYTLDVTTAGVSGTAVLTCTSAIAGDACNPSATYTWFDNEPIPIGSFEVLVAIDDTLGTGLAGGEQVEIPVTAGSPGTIGQATCTANCGDFVAKSGSSVQKVFNTMYNKANTYPVGGVDVSYQSSTANFDPVNPAGGSAGNFIGPAVKGIHNGDDLAESSGTYTGTESQLYTVTVTTGGAPPAAQITVTSTGSDSSGPTTVTAFGDDIEVGTLGVFIRFTDNADLTPGIVGPAVDPDDPVNNDDTAASGGTYAGTADGTYTVTVTTGGRARNAVIDYTSDITGDTSGNVCGGTGPQCAYDTPFDVGIHGVTITITEANTSNFVANDDWTIAVTAGQTPDGGILVSGDTWNIQATLGCWPNCQEVDYVAFCLGCHDGVTPPGVTLSANLPDIASDYIPDNGGDQHGNGDGSTGANTSKGPLKRPWTDVDGNDPSQNYAALPCTTCHDQHGSPSIFHLKESINVAGQQLTTGSTKADVFSGLIPSTTYTLPANGGSQTFLEYGAWCTFCHTMGGHTGVTEASTCNTGHVHGGNNF